MDSIRATPYEYELLGLLADKLKKAQDYATSAYGEFGVDVSPALNLLGIPAVQQTMERVAYGEPLTTGKGMTTKVRPEVMEAALTLLPVAGKTAQVAERGAMAAGRAGERLAERVVPQIMERGGMPASLLEGMATNTTSKMFIGASSPMFDKDMALKASQMAKKGSSPQEIWKATGTVKGPDGQWRQEISDKLSSYDPEALADLRALDNFNYLEHTQPLGGTLEHKELYKAYPDIGDMPVHFAPEDKMQGAYGAYSPKHDRMTLSQSLTPEKARSSALHETQHAIQEREGFAVGGNARDFARMKNEANNQITELNQQMSDVVKWMNDPSTTEVQKQGLRKQYEDLMDQRMQLVKTAQLDPTEAYANLMGEAEARLTQRRMDLTPEQRKQYYPFEYTGETGYGLDVKPENLIHMTQSGDIVERGLLGAAPKVVERGPAESLLDYRGSHTAPGPDFGAPLHDLTGGGQMYPADVYSPKAAQYYGTGYPKADKEAFDLAKRVKGNPDAEVTMYRAVPNNKDITDINAGDWVTLSKDYAKTHGESVLGDYKIISKKVKAKDLWTNADSIHEFGYHPSAPTSLLDVPKQQTTPLFETGKEITFPFIKNTEKAPKMTGFGQDIEPAGNYILSGHDSDTSKLAKGWVSGEKTFKNPLVIDWGSGLYSDPDNWKNVLSSQYGGKTGKALSKAIAKDGYDGIVTMNKYGPSEIVDLTMFVK